jgi:tetratricopeptide (TPR) repeat protein
MALALPFDLNPASGLPVRRDRDAQLRAIAQNSPSGEEAASPENLNRIERLEKQFFFKLYPADIVAVRMQRLEKEIFGVTMNGSLNQRLETLENSLAEKDPGTGQPLAQRKEVNKGRSDKSALSSQPSPVISASNIASASPIDPPTTTAPAPIKSSDPATSQSATKSDDASHPAAGDLPQVNSVLHITKERYVVRGNPDAYIRQVNNAMQMNPQDPSFSFERAKALIQLGKWDRALSDLSDAILSRPSNAEYYLARAFVYTKLGNCVLAREDVNHARFYNSQLPAEIEFHEAGIVSKK